MDDDRSFLLKGIAIRSVIAECPFGAFKVSVSRCSGAGECADVCLVNVFGVSEDGKCTVVNDALCFGCMACMAQCRENGVVVTPRDSKEYVMLEELLK